MPGSRHVPVTDRRTPLLLAVYGTLRRGCRNAHLLDEAEPLGRGLVAGTLHEVASPLRGRAFSYPVLVLDDDIPDDQPPRAPGRVVVEVYRVRTQAQLHALDVLEAYDPDDPDGSEYLRVRVPLLAGPAGVEAVQVYVHTGTAEQRGPVLPDGDWYTWAGALR